MFPRRFANTLQLKQLRLEGWIKGNNNAAVSSRHLPLRASLNDRFGKWGLYSGPRTLPTHGSCDLTSGFPLLWEILYRQAADKMATVIKFFDVTKCDLADRSPHHVASASCAG